MGTPVKPQSPWAARFGLYQDQESSFVIDDGRAHSGFAPLRPRLDPKYYDAEPGEDEFTLPITGKEFDEIFVTEDLQRIMTRGVPMWGVAPLNNNLSLWDENPKVLGGHNPGDVKSYPDLLKSYMEQRIEIRPETWLPCFDKSHWYDLILPEPDTVKEEDGTTRTIEKWSVDDERVWNEVSFINEITNRMLLALIRDNNTWLGTLLYGRVQRWYELFEDLEGAGESKLRDRVILYTPTIERELCRTMNRPFVGQNIEPDAQKREKFVRDLLEHHYWSFLVPSNPAHGNTSRGFPLTTFGRINSAIIRYLCYGRLTISERCVVYAETAMTVAPEDELMHALFLLRQDNTLANISPEALPSLDLNNEPYVNGEPIAELGRSFEAAVFGGTPTEGPIMESETFHPERLMMSNIAFPSILGKSSSKLIDENHPAMQQTAQLSTSFIPAALLWRLQSKAFWDPTPPNGQTGFLFPRVFNNKFQILPHHQKIPFLGVTIDNDADKDGRFQDVVAGWTKRQSLWGARRPWYILSLFRWQRSPWSHVMLRISVDRFRQAFKKKDEAGCANMAWSMDNAIPPENMGVRIHPAIPGIDSKTGEPSAWLFNCLGTCMLAALPRRTTEQTEVDAFAKIAYDPSKSLQATNPTGLEVLANIGTKVPQIWARNVSHSQSLSSSFW
ncbi:hypothetical protein F5X98DRAFT_368802 [Xylaria grammica]|nr:hypothetical protein F5X98DRAFT_368802 [Xylaria grammica]